MYACNTRINYKFGWMADYNGRTLKAIQETLLEIGALNVKIAVLVEKKLERPDGIEHADWAGFFMDDRYLIGCGMDAEEKYRHYPGIAVLG